MPPVLWKDLLAEIRHSLGRYLSITFIVALGVAFFAGIKASAPDMKNSADSYFDKYSVQDIQVFSTLGLQPDDLDALKKLAGVQEAQGQFSMDYLARQGDRELTVKAISFTEGQALNQPRLIEGRLPQAEDECLIEADSATGKIFGTFQIGDTIDLYSGNSTPVDDTLNLSSFKIVGKAYNPNYLSYELGTSSIGSGKVDTFIYILQDAVKADYYTEIDLEVAGAKEKDAYSDDYFALTGPVVDEVDALADTQIAAALDRYNAEIDKNEQEADARLADGQAQLDQAKAQLDGGRAQIESSQKQLADARTQLDQGKIDYDNGLKQYEEGKKQLDEGLKQVNDGIAQINSGIARLPELQQQREQLQQALDALPGLDSASDAVAALNEQLYKLNTQIERLERLTPNSPLLDSLRNSRSDLQNRLNQAEFDASDTYNEILSQIGGSQQAGQENLRKLDEGIAQIEQGQKQLPELEKTRSELLARQDELPQAKAQLDQAKARLDTGEQEYKDGMAQLASGQAELDAGQKEYDKNLAEFEKQKRDAKQKIADARQKLEEMGAKWIVLDRDSHYSYRDYEACAERMDGIASVFPVFFFLVAALVCMTTMTRMVDEQRNEMGTLKALGYSRWQIAAKYLVYAGSASVIGSIIGCAAGMLIFPQIIYMSWNIMYNLEGLQYRFQPGLMLLASGLVTLVVLGATYFSIYKEMREVPAQLMRPKAAKAGKRILLERIPWFWQKLSFMHKVTLRNLFRYKKRFFMTVIGISGCSALLLAGFGLNDSIGDIARLQYGSIYHYDAMVQADTSLTWQETEELAQTIEQFDEVNAAASIQVVPITVHYDNKDITASLNVVPDPKAFEPFMSFHLSDGTTTSALPASGAYVSIKTADKLGLKPGDELEFKTAQYEKQVKVEVAGIFDQYVGQEVYMSESEFEKLGIKDAPAMTILLQDTSTDPDFESQLGKKLMDQNSVRSITFYSSLIANFQNMISSIKLVVYVLVLCAAMLAFVVLYNLSNVNISERLREIATIKVLGFTEKEVNAYVNRETIILALIGSVTGLLLGIYLHSLIMNLAEMDTIRFGRTIYWQSYLYSIGLTMLFTLMVNFIMKYQLRKIQMVESLKAVE